MDENYTTGTNTIPWFGSASNNHYDSGSSDYSASAKPESRRGFRIKPGVYIPFPFWHKFVATPPLLDCSYKRKLVIQRMLIRGAYSRKYDRPRRKLGKRMKLF